MGYVIETPVVEGGEEMITEKVSSTQLTSSQHGFRFDEETKKSNTSLLLQYIKKFCKGLPDVNEEALLEKVLRGLSGRDDFRTFQDQLISTSALLISDEPQYSKFAARVLAEKIRREVQDQAIHCFLDSIQKGAAEGLISEKAHELVRSYAETFNSTIKEEHTDEFEYFGLRTLYDRYLLKDPKSRKVIETPQYFFLRVAVGLSEEPDNAIHFYNLLSKFDYMPSSPTLFNSATTHPQLSSCYLLDSPKDDLIDIYKRYTDIARLSKFAGGIGVAYSRVRSNGSLIKGTNGHSNGIVPWLKTLDSSVAAVNQGGKRKGAACVYLETWHADIEEFLELRDNTGDDARRAHNINIANWVPDLFMERVEQDGVWSLFDPKKVPDFTDLFGEEFEKAYVKAEKEGLYEKQVQARALYSRMMKTLAQTGNGWMTFKDASNKKCNQTKNAENVVHLSNLCTEILEATSSSETAVCNLGSVNLSRHVNAKGQFDFEKLGNTVRLALRNLDRVVDINFYPIEEASQSNNRWRPVGLGIMGLQDVFFKMDLAYDSEEAKKISRRIQEEIYFHALSESCTLAEKNGAHDAFHETRASDGDLQFDLWGIEPHDHKRWQELRNRIQKHGLRNSLMIAIAPTATIATLVGVYEAMEPQVSNLFKRETLSGEFLQINKYLIQDLKDRGIWNETVRSKLKQCEGSIQNIDEIPEDLKNLYRTAWELSMKSLIDMAAERGPFIDQSQSLNLFVESPSIGKLSSMYFYAWKKGLKTTYYLRSRPATRINKTTVGSESGSKKAIGGTAAVSCSLENPEVCEACQ